MPTLLSLSDPLLALVASAGLRPLEPDVTPGVPWSAIAGIGLLAVAAAIAVWRRDRSPRRGREDPASKPPATLRSLLEGVRKAGWIEGGEQLRACDAIADVLRDLARTRFDVLSGRLTTAELLGELASRGAPDALCGPMGDVLSACDLVKFAGARLEAGELRGHLETALILVDAAAVTTDEAAPTPNDAASPGQPWLG